MFEEVKDMRWFDWHKEEKISELKLIKDFIIWKFRCQKVIGNKNYNKEMIEKESELLVQRHKNAKWIQ